MGKRELVAFLVSRDCCVALPRGAKVLSAVCDCGISWSYSLFLGAALREELNANLFIFALKVYLFIYC